MGIYVPTQFYAGNGGAVTGDVTLYTVPVGKTAIVTEVTCHPQPGGANYLYLNSGDTKLMYSTTQYNTSTYRWSGFWVLPAGHKIIQATFTSGSMFTHVSGLLGDGALNEKTPTLLGTVVHSNGNDVTMFNGGANGAILKTVQVSNTANANRTYALRHAATPLTPWSGAYVLGPYACNQLNFSVYVAPGVNITSNAMDGLSGITATAHGWRL